MSPDRLNQEDIRRHLQQVQAIEGTCNSPVRHTSIGDKRPSLEQMNAVSFATGGREVQRLKRLVAEVPEIREDRVAELRKQIRSGAYQVSVELLARKLLGIVDA